MKAIRLSRFALSVTAAVLLAGCGGSSPPTAAPGTIEQLVKSATSYHRHTSSVENVLYRFAGGKNGANPEGVIEAEIYEAPMLFGTTYDGGTERCRGSGKTSGCGTIFGVPVSGKHYLFHFRYAKRGSEGALPEAGMIYAGGELFYGTTAFGGLGCGSRGCGTVFALVPFGTSSTYYIFHKFKGGTDGEEPLALVQGTKALYGTTWVGGGSGCGGSGCGTVFEISFPYGTESVFSFPGGSGGYEPNSLIDVKGELYGTTWSGGSSTCASEGCGTVFKLDPASGTLSTIYSFEGSTDGAGPKNLIELDGRLYGTTSYGGGSGCGGDGCGTVFKVNPKTGAEKILYSFQGGGDGVAPDALLELDGTLYGTTYYGGGASACTAGYAGCGTIFEIGQSGQAYSVLYRFQGGTDGAHPTAMSKSRHTFYGTTWSGGGSGCNGFGCGTVFEATP